MEPSVTVALIAVAGTVITGIMNWLTLKDFKRAQTEREEAEAAGALTDSAVGLIGKLEARAQRLSDRVDRLEAVNETLCAKINELETEGKAKDKRIAELEGENARLTKEVKELKMKLDQLSEETNHGAE